MSYYVMLTRRGIGSLQEAMETAKASLRTLNGGLQDGEWKFMVSEEAWAPSRWDAESKEVPNGTT